MTSVRPDWIVVSREDDEARNRSGYSFKLLLLALLPFAYVFIVLGVILTIFGLLLWTIISGEGRDGPILRIQIALAVVAALFLRSIWVRVPAPKSITTPGSHPESGLLTTAHEIARKIRGPKVDAIQWTEEFDLSITPTPRFSLLSWPLRYYLEVGLPLMQALSPEQFNARLANELGHFAKTHGRFRSWVYRHHFTWMSLSAALKNRGRWGSWVFSRFFDWYVKFFLKYSASAFRYHEYEADRCAADLTTAEITTEALLRISHGAQLENDYEEDRKAETDSYTFVAELLKRSLVRGEAKEWLECELEGETLSYQVRPVLKDRLAALGETVRVPAPVAQSAAEAYLGDDLPQFSEQLKEAVWEQFGPTWEGPEDEEPSTGSRDRDELLRRSQQPDFTADEALELGRQLLEEDEERGVAFVTRAMELDPDWRQYVCTTLSNYYSRKGDIITAHRYNQLVEIEADLYQKANAERTQVSFMESFKTHDLSEWEMQMLLSELTKHRQIKEAYLVRKEVTYVPRKPHHALGLVLDRPWFGSAEEFSLNDRLRPARKYPPEIYSFVLDYRNRRLGNIIRNVANSLIYQRSDQNSETK